MKITTVERDGVHVLNCEGALSIGPAAEALEAECKRWVGKGRGIVLELSAVPYIDSTGVATVVACAERASSTGKKVKVVLAARGAARKAFEITQLDQILEVFEDGDAAVASFS